MSNTNSMILSPSVLAADYTILGEQLRKLDKAGAQYVHLDVMDGKFVPSISLGMPIIKSLRKATRRIFDVHLMIEEPIRYMNEFAGAGADIITFHFEACKDVQATIEKVKECGCKVGMALKPATDVEVLVPYLKELDMILIMTVEPGFGGQKLIPETLEKVRQVKQKLTELGLHTDIQVDGGITLENVKEAVEAGANVIVAGTAVFQNDIEKNVSDFLERMK